MQRRDMLTAAAALVGPGIATGSVSESGADGPVAEYTPLGRVLIPNAMEAVVGDDDRVYVATGDGYTVVDASDPSDPTVVADVEEVTPPDGDGRLRRIFDVKYDEDRLLVAGQHDPDGEPVLGFAVVDVSDPGDPEQVLFEELDFSVHNCYLDGDVAYLTSGPDDHDTFTVYDVSGGSATELATWRAVEASERWEPAFPASGPSAHDLWVQDGLAYPACWDAGVFVVDVSDPADPQYVAECGGIDPEELASMSKDARFAESRSPPGNAHYTATDQSGDLLGVGGEAWEHEGEGGPMGIDLYDVSDPADPELLSTVEPPTLPGADERAWRTAHNFEIRDDVLYSSWYRGGVRRHDVSDPTDPVEETWWRRPVNTWFWTARVLEPGETFVASSMDRGVRPALYVLPDEPGRSKARYSSTPGGGTSTPTPVETATPDGGRTSPTDGPPDEPTATPSPTPETSPGFGPLATTAALGYGLWRYGRRTEE